MNVAEIWRYPVKTMGGELLARALATRALRRRQREQEVARRRQDVRTVPRERHEARLRLNQAVVELLHGPRGNAEGSIVKAEA